MKPTQLIAMVLLTTGLHTTLWAEDAPPPPELSAAETADASTTAETATQAPTDSADTSNKTSVTTADSTVTTEQVGRIQVQTIRVADRYGTIEEERVPAMRSEVRYVPADNENGGYNLVASENSAGKTQNAHSSGDDALKIPSWKMFSW